MTVARDADGSEAGYGGVMDAVAEVLPRVEAVFSRQLHSDLPPVSELCGHLEQYRGKMLRPQLVLLCGLAARPGVGAGSVDGGGAGVLGEDHVIVAAVCEMIHMATLVHDDVLDEAEVRRGGRTLNRLVGNESAVILGDYLIAASYHLCSQLDDQQVAVMLGRTSMTMCAGELLQLHHREDFSLDEATYFEIVERKTGALIAMACELGARCSGAGAEVAEAYRRFGARLGTAFQIQDDLLDLMGSEQVVGKSVRKDLEKGKPTLPLICHLAGAGAAERGRVLSLVRRIGKGDGESAMGELAALLDASGAVEAAHAEAGRCIGEARAALGGTPENPARAALLAMADALQARER